MVIWENPSDVTVAEFWQNQKSSSLRKQIYFYIFENNLGMFLFTVVLLCKETNAVAETDSQAKNVKNLPSYC